MEAFCNLVTDQKRARKDKSAENGGAKAFFPNCCRNVTIHDNILNSELRWRDADEGAGRAEPRLWRHAGSVTAAFDDADR